MSYAIVQHTSGSGSGTGLTTSKSLPGAPTAGNWLIASVCLQKNGSLTDQSFCPIDTSKWFLIDDALVGIDASISANSDNILRVIGRKVQAGDTSSMPAFCVSGSSFFAWTVVEVSGGSGTWTTDFHSARNAIDASTGTTVTSPKDTTLVANTLGLVFWAGYNETVAGTISSGWTADENTVNSGNYGSYGVAHQAFSTAGTSFSATFTRVKTTTDPHAIVTVLLTPSQPTTPHIKRHRLWTGGGSAGTPGSIGMGGVPADGNLLVVHLLWEDGGSAGPTVSGSWTDYINAANGSNPIVLGLYRYASSETRNLPALATAGTHFWAANAFEIGGVTGTFSTDHVSSKAGYQASGSSMVTTSDTTTAANQLVTTTYGNYAATSAITAPTGADLLESEGTNGQWGGVAAAENYETSSGTTVQTTWTAISNIRPSGYIQDIWGLVSAIYTLTSAQGSYTLSGKSILFETGRRVVATQGSYTLTGEAVASRKNLSVPAVHGTYTVTGFSTLSHLVFGLLANFGSYHLVGFDVTQGHNRTLKAKRGRYRVKKQKTILRLNQGQSIIWPVDDGEYDLLGQDVSFGDLVYVLTFSAFQNPALIDWATESGAGYVSYLDTNFLVPGDPMSFANVPYLYVFLEDGASEDDVGLLMTVAKNWATDENAPDLGRETQVYRFRDGYALSLTKNRIRGKGRVFQVRFRSDAEKDFNIRGWAGMIEKNLKV